MEDIEYIEQTINQCDQYDDPVPKNRHLVIDLHYVPESQDGIQTDYYFVDHDRRKVFFLDPFEAESMDAWWEAPGCNSMKHLGRFHFYANLLNYLKSLLGIEMEAQYW